MAAEQVDKVKMLTDQISPILHGHKPEIQGAVLAELLATWLAGHVVPGDSDANHPSARQVIP